ncbi:hypothetical protein PM082_019718 [Marasmius tenuissimus]|nr:hypothetical protein PM082_019718 [Marasmius tenuissimus]
MYCIPHPLPDPLFYWSWDPKGKTVISEKDWEQSGIPRLEVETWGGSYWLSDDYRSVESHLHTKSYDIDGKQYAQAHGYPELIWGDPHARRITELENTDSDEDLENSNQHEDSEELDESWSSISQPAYPSTSLLVDLPVECCWPTRENKILVMKPTRKNLRKSRAESEVNMPQCRKPNVNQIHQNLLPKDQPRLKSEAHFLSLTSTIFTVASQLFDLRVLHGDQARQTVTGGCA